MGSGGIPNRPKIDPNWEEMRQITQSGYQMAPKTPWINVPHSFLPIFGVSSGTPKSTKNPFLAKKGAPGNAFLPVLVANAAFLDFLADFCRFLVKSRCKNRRMFLHLLVFFSNWRPSRNTVFCDAKPTFSFFVFIICF